MRIAINQDLVLPWVPTNLVHAIHDELRTLDLVTPGARTIADVTGCPGATTCNLGITRSLTLADVLAKELAGEADPEVMKMHIKISGCPNSCGQHQIADIGFYGNARKLGDRQIPYYQLLLGGKIDSNGVHFGRQVMAVPARPVPDIIRELISAYKEHREDGESFSDWAVRTPDDAIIERLRAYPISKTPQPTHSSTGATLRSIRSSSAAASAPRKAAISSGGRSQSASLASLLGFATSPRALFAVIKNRVQR